MRFSIQDLPILRPSILRTISDGSSADLVVRMKSAQSERTIRNRIGTDEVLSRLRVILAHILYNKRSELMIGFVTVLNFAVILHDTDINARNDTPPTWLIALNWLCLAVFTLELTVRTYVERMLLFNDPWNWLDMIVVMVGFAEVVLDILGLDSIPLGPMRTLRCMRLLRMLKVFVLVNHLRDLRKLVRGIMGCLRVLFWAMCLVFLFVTMWAVVAVEILHPIMPDVKAEGVWDSCHRCEEAFSSIMSANLTFLYTIVAGDSWPYVALPIMQKYPPAAFIFIGALFTINIGLLNLVVAVLVDTAGEARANDIQAREVEEHAREVAERKDLAKIFKEIDAGAKGSLTFEELAEGARNVEEFRQKLRVMDIQGADLQELFAMLDQDQSGEIDADEFIDALYRMKCGDDKTAGLFVKYCVVGMKKTQSAMIDHIRLLEDELQNTRKSIRKKGAFGSLAQEGLGEVPSLKSSLPWQGSSGSLMSSWVSESSDASRYSKFARARTSDDNDDVHPVTPSPLVQHDADIVSPQHESIMTSSPSPCVQPDAAISRVPNTPRTELHKMEHYMPASKCKSTGIPWRSQEFSVIDSDLTSLEHQLMRDDLAQMLDEAEKQVNLQLHERIQAKFSSISSEIMGVVMKEGRAKMRSNDGMTAANQELAEVFNTIGDSLDSELTAAFSQALQPIRTWQDVRTSPESRKMQTPRKNRLPSTPKRSCSFQPSDDHQGSEQTVE